jgi:hypothetical protein
MKAGRELDKVIAERVMTVWVPKNQIPLYSSRIDDAWQVVERMRESRTSVLRIVGLIQGYRVAFSDIRWSSADSDMDLSRPYYVKEAVADTLPEAICLAALRAVGVDVD